MCNGAEHLKITFQNFKSNLKMFDLEYFQSKYRRRANFKNSGTGFTYER